MKLGTNSTSCSTSRIAKPCSACTARRVRARSAVSWRSRPDDGSSSSSSRGLGHEGAADLDQPALPEAEVLDRLVGQVAQPEQVEHLVAALDLVRPSAGPVRAGPSRGGRRPGGRARRSAGARARSTRRTARCAGTSGRCPRRARRWTGRSLTSSPVAAAPCPVVGRSTPSTQLKNVVLPAPFGPISPTRSPSSTCDA